jgi:hypothetical protein
MSVDVLRVISLDRTPQRFAKFLASNPHVPVERVSAVDGARIARADCVRDSVITDANSYNPGALGVAMSHTALWRQCAAGSKPFHIAEDDAIVRADFPTSAAAALATLAEWDVVLWLHNFDWPVMVRPPGGVGPVVMQYQPDDGGRTWDEFRAAEIAPMLLPLLSAGGIGCYSISPQGARNLLADCLPIGADMAEYVAKPGSGWSNTGLDVEMSRHYGQRRAFFAFPPLAVAPNDQSASTIRGHLAAMHDPAIANKAVV